MEQFENIVKVIELIGKAVGNIATVCSVLFGFLAYLNVKRFFARRSPPPLPEMPYFDAGGRPFPEPAANRFGIKAVVDFAKQYNARIWKFELLVMGLPFVSLMLLCGGHFQAVNGLLERHVVPFFDGLVRGTQIPAAGLAAGLFVAAFLVVLGLGQLVTGSLASAGARELRNRVAAYHFTDAEQMQLAKKLKAIWWGYTPKKHVQALMDALENAAAGPAFGMT